MGRNKAPEFREFWDAYGLKRDRLAAERAWNRLSARDKAAALAGIPAYREDCRRQGIAMMYGQGYLNHRRWEDEPLASGSPDVNGADALDDMEKW